MYLHYQADADRLYLGSPAVLQGQMKTDMPVRRGGAKANLRGTVGVLGPDLGGSYEENVGELNIVHDTQLESLH